jgi:hypothetical protein
MATSYTFEREHLELARAFRKKSPTACRLLDWNAREFEDGHRELAYYTRIHPPPGWPEAAINGAVCYCTAVAYGLVKPLVSADAIAEATGTESADGGALPGAADAGEAEG